MKAVKILRKFGTFGNKFQNWKNKFTFLARNRTYSLTHSKSSTPGWDGWIYASKKWWIVFWCFCHSAWIISESLGLFAIAMFSTAIKPKLIFTTSKPLMPKRSSIPCVNIFRINFLRNIKIRDFIGLDGSLLLVLSVITTIGSPGYSMLSEGLVRKGDSIPQSCTNQQKMKIRAVDYSFSSSEKEQVNSMGFQANGGTAITWRPEW